jgi:hypothetical protein
MGKLWRRIYFLWNRDRLDRELAEEMAAHREMMPADRLRNFGNGNMPQHDRAADLGYAGCRRVRGRPGDAVAGAPRPAHRSFDYVAGGVGVSSHLSTHGVQFAPKRSLSPT